MIRFRLSSGQVSVTLLYYNDTNNPGDLPLQVEHAVRVASRLRCDDELHMKVIPDGPTHKVNIRELYDRSEMFCSKKYKDAFRLVADCFTKPEVGRNAMDDDSKEYVLDQQANGGKVKGLEIYFCSANDQAEEKVFLTFDKAKAWVELNVNRNTGKYRWWEANGVHFYGQKDVASGSISLYPVES